MPDLSLLAFNRLRGVEKERFLTGVTNSVSVTRESLPLCSVVLFMVSTKFKVNNLLNLNQPYNC